MFQDLEMKWQGYATKHLQIILKPFQVESLKAFHNNNDSIIVQATGFGKSTCFHLPALMLPPNHYGIIIVPTVALGEDHRETLKSMKISSVFLHSSSSREDYKQAFDLLPETQRAKMVILQPEMIFGTNTNKGILGRLLKNKERLNFIAIDEGHLVFDWGSFRSDFREIARLKSLFACPIMVLSATLKPTSLNIMATDILRNPVIVKGTIDRPNVALHILPYRKSSAVEAKSHAGDVWYKTAKTIKEIVAEDKTIIYCAFAAECEELILSLKKLNVTTACYTGKKTNKEKMAIFQQVKDGTIDILVATKAFGLGINLPNIRHVFHVGLPESLAAWMQEYGRAGRDGHPAHAHLLVCDHEDMKKLNFWMKNATSNEQRTSLQDDYATVWKYYSKAFTGECLRSFQTNYFEDENTVLPPLTDGLCCTGCQLHDNVPLTPAKELRAVLQIFKFLQKKGIRHLFETQIIDWVQGNKQNWMWLYFNSEDLQEEFTFGLLKSIPETTAKIIVKVVLRQCLSMSFVELEFDANTNESKTMVKLFSITSDGCDMANDEIELPLMPDPKAVAKVLLEYVLFLTNWFSHK